MAKKNLPCGHAESDAIYFGNAMACANTNCFQDPKRGDPSKHRKWEWQPAQWVEVYNKPKQAEEEQPSRNPVLGPDIKVVPGH